MSVNTFVKYRDICLQKGFCWADERGNYHYISYPAAFNAIFGEKKGKFIRINKVQRTFQVTKEAIRCALLLANYKEQDFLILGECSQERGFKPSRKAAYAKAWVREHKSIFAPKAKKVLTSARHAGNVLGMSFVTGNKTLFRLMEWGEVKFRFLSRRVKITGTIEAKIAFAEQNRPFPGCTFSLIKGGVKFHLGREVIFL